MDDHGMVNTWPKLGQRLTEAWSTVDHIVGHRMTKRWDKIGHFMYFPRFYDTSMILL